MKGIVGLRTNLNVGMDTKIKVPLVQRARLISRVVLDNFALTGCVAPYGATYAVARVLGAGGGNVLDSASPGVGAFVGGGGGAYARSTFEVVDGLALTVQVGRYSNTEGLRASAVSINALVKAYAEGGFPSNLGVSGVGGSFGVGDTVVSGEAPAAETSSFFYGGNAPGDSSEDDSVLCAGNGAVVRKTALNTPASSVRFGGGGAVFYNGTGSSTPVAGAGGLVVIEFYDGDPRA